LDIEPSTSSVNLRHLIKVAAAAVAASAASGIILYVLYGKPEIYPVAGLIGMVAAGMAATTGGGLGAGDNSAPRRR
jgi:hypothetical protein